MTNIGTGHWIFAGAFVLIFGIAIIYAYRKDFSKIGKQYRHVWLIIIGILAIYFTIFFLNRIT